jgi:predicted MFS family arabinose efflux permease
MYTTVSYPVAAPSHVWIVATPDVVGVQRKTRSGALPLFAHVPASVLAPLVVPVNEPPAAGTSVALSQAAIGVGTTVGWLAGGGVTDSRKAPAPVAYPSTTMKYV